MAKFKWGFEESDFDKLQLIAVIHELWADSVPTSTALTEFPSSMLQDLGISTLKKKIWPDFDPTASIAHLLGSLLVWSKLHPENECTIGDQAQ